MVPGYQITQKVHETERSVIYRALRGYDGWPVVLKMLNSQYPTPREHARYRQEFEIICSLDHAGVIKAYSLERHKNTLFLVLEDFGGSSLNLLFAKQLPTISQFLELAIQMSLALGYVHQQGIIHKDINPSNIAWNAASNQLKIIDFGLSTRLSSESPGIKNPNILEGTLPYCSPEQTGRMNRHLDYRSDFYSLGVTFYELLTGHLPFDRRDALELVHCHIAAQPRPPIELRGDIPPLLSRIIMKLLAKTAEERYQSAWGLKADLEACREQLLTGREPAMFALGRRDISDRLEFSQKLYGRAHETQALLHAFDRAAHGHSEIILITGYSGIGKSSLARELYEPITKTKAFFVSGKFDQLQRATPYSALLATFSQLIKQLFTETRQELLRWQTQLLAALGPNGRILTELIPELELIIGPQAEVEELGPVEAQNRLTLTLCSFVRVFAQPAHPLVVFLDDLQWADSATLRFLEPLMTDQEIRHFLLIGAYRDNEVDATHPLSTVLESLAERQVAIGKIHLQPLALADTFQFLAETFQFPGSSVAELAELVFRRTGGNPFFVKEFLKVLHQEGVLRFDVTRPGWSWSITELESMPVTESVAELLSTKLRKFPESIQKSLRLAACIGNTFDVHTIAIIADQPVAETFAALLEAAREGSIHPLSEPELVSVTGPVAGQETQLLIREYKFAHDRVQQAAYALIPPEQRTAIHLEIGRLLLAKLSPVEKEERLFELVDHLNLGRSLLGSQSGQAPLTREDLASMNLAAGRRAKEAAAYAAAAQYLAIGIELAGHAWETHGELTLALYMEGAETEYCNGNFERSQVLIDTALARATSVLVKARLYQLAIIQYTNQAKHGEAMRVARAALQLLGHALPPPGQHAAVARAELAELEQLLDDRAIEALDAAPEMTEETHRAAFSIVAGLTPSAFMTDVDMFHLLTARMVKLSLAHGHFATSAYGYAIYTILLAGLGHYQRAYKIGRLAIRMAEHFHSAIMKCKAGEVLIAHVHHWTQPLRAAKPISMEAFEAGLQSGELQYAAFVLMYHVGNLFYQGEELSRILADGSAGFQFARRNKNALVMSTFQGLLSAAAHLAEATDRGAFVDMENDADYIARCRQEESFLSLCMYQVLKCQVLYLFENYESALEAAREAEKLLDYVPGVISVAPLNFHHSLCLTALYPRASAEQQKQYWQVLEAHQAQMALWAESCPANFRHMQLLVAAEMARLRGDDFTAVQRYTQAIESAGENEFSQNLALANELAARFWLAREQPLYAMLHMKNAHYHYVAWGAKRKAAMLERRYEQLLMQPLGDGARSSSRSISTRPSASTVGIAEQLDLSSVIKASQALTGEIALDKLLARLIAIVIENAGAQHGCLILKRKDRLVIEAMGTLGKQHVEVLKSLPLEDQGDHRSMASIAIVHYVLRSGETVVLHDAAQEGAFVRDPHVVAHKSRSILCMPLLNQGEVAGVVYLENNLSSQAFTPERVELLKLLSSQMAISLDNSFLYSNLQQASQDLERLLFSIAHDLKEPLRAIQSFSELLMHRYGPQIDIKGRDYLTRIVDAGQRMGTLLDAIRRVSDIRRSDWPRSQVPGEQLVEEAINNLRPVVEQTQATIRIAPGLPQLAVHRRWAVEAIYQVIMNSLQYTHRGMAPDIEIAPYEGSEGLGLVIMDRGLGVPEEYVEKVFELFRRMVGRELVGAGAGLAIVRQIAAKHGGSAWLRPRTGGGTEVYITFGR